jgi:hypothetical protein
MIMKVRRFCITAVPPKSHILIIACKHGPERPGHYTSVDDVEIRLALSLCP